jgi:biopolymer transport protein ExbD
MAKAPSALRGGKKTEGMKLNITSMMDMFTIILVFLLKSFSSSPEASVTLSADIKLPGSGSDKPPIAAVTVLVTQRQIIVDDTGSTLVVAEIDDFAAGTIKDVEEKMFKIEALTTHLTTLRERQIEVNKYRTEGEFKGEILIQADEKIPFSILKKVMYSIGQAEFGEFKFITIAEKG